MLSVMQSFMNALRETIGKSPLYLDNEGRGDKREASMSYVRKEALSKLAKPGCPRCCGSGYYIGPADTDCNCPCTGLGQSFNRGQVNAAEAPAL